MTTNVQPASDTRAAQFDDTVVDPTTGFTTKALVFEWRPLDRQYRRSTQRVALMVVVVGLSLLNVAFVFWKITQTANEYAILEAAWKALTWHDLEASFAKKARWETLMGIGLNLIALPIFVWGQRRMRGSRLFLSDSELRHRSGLPLWLGNLLKQNWRLSLDDFRSGKLAFTLSGQPRALHPLALHFWTWKTTQGTTQGLLSKKLAPTSWFLSGQEAREPIKMPKGLFWRSMDPWRTQEGQEVLQRAFDQLPLVAALRAQRVPLPPFADAKRLTAGGGVDLMAYPRLKAVTWSFFGLLLSAALAYHLMRHQNYFEQPPVWVWAAFGACCALGAWSWLAAEQTPTEPSLKATQGVVAVLLGVAAALVAPSALLAANQALRPEQQISVTVSHDPLRLTPNDGSIPAFKPAQAREFWASQSASAARQLSVRKGIFGTWQYDSTPLEDEVDAFYQKHGSR